MNDPFNVHKELDAVVGTFEAHPGERFLRRYGRWLGRAAAAAVLALATAATIFFVLDKHVTDARTAPAPKRPVNVQIVPAPP